MIVLNDGRKPTIIRGNTKPYIDLTCSTKYLYEISDWEVLEEKPDTEHQYISTFEIKTGYVRVIL